MLNHENGNLLRSWRYLPDVGEQIRHDTAEQFQILYQELGNIHISDSSQDYQFLFRVKNMQCKQYRHQLTYCQWFEWSEICQIDNIVQVGLTSFMSGYCLFRLPAAEMTDLTALIPKSQWSYKNIRILHLLRRSKVPGDRRQVTIVSEQCDST